jgi:hypothetical protein
VIDEALIAALSPRLCENPSVEALTSQYAGGPSWRISGREFLHQDRDGTFDLRLTAAAIPANRAKLAAEPRIFFRAGKSDWVWLQVRTLEDVENLATWAELAIEANTADRQG